MITTTKAQFFHLFKLEEKFFTLQNVDFQVLGNIAVAKYPLSFSTKNVKVIDYQNINAGFIFAVDCNYEGAAIIGEIVFDNLNFIREKSILDRYKTGGLINIAAPANITIKNSVFNIQHRALEDFDMIKIEDSGLCTIGGENVQIIDINSNSFSFYDSTKSIFNNIRMFFSGADQRFQRIAISNNTFSNMNGAVKEIVDINLYSAGSVLLSGNRMVNCSSEAYLVSVKADQTIYLESNQFDRCTAGARGFISTNLAQNISVKDLRLSNSKHDGSSISDALIKLDSAEYGFCSFENAVFNSNYVEASILEFDRSLGSLFFKNNSFYNELLDSGVTYISFESLYQLEMLNTTFTNISDNASEDKLTQLLDIDEVSLEREGVFRLDSVTVSNTTVSFFSLRNLLGRASTLKQVFFHNIVVKDSTIRSRSNFITFGPLYSSEEVKLQMKNIRFDNINFIYEANIIHVNQQTKYPLEIIE